MKKKNAGITLVALVITIIVLIILAGVSINSVMNGGLIENAKSARDEFSKTSESEGKDIDSLTLKTDMLVAEATSGNAGGASESTLVASSGILAGIEVGTTVAELESMLPQGYSILKANGNGFSTEEDAEGKTEKERAVVGTGMQIVKNGVEVSRVVIYGDIEGDGTNDAADASWVYNETLTNYQKVAADVNVDGYLDCEDADIIMQAGERNQVIVPVNGTNIKNRTNLEWFESKVNKIIDLAGEKFIKLEKINNEEGNPSTYEIYLSSDAELSVVTARNTLKGGASFAVQVLDADSNVKISGNIGNGYILKFSTNNTVDCKIKFIMQ